MKAMCNAGHSTEPVGRDALNGDSAQGLGGMNPARGSIIAERSLRGWMPKSHQPGWQSKLWNGERSCRMHQRVGH
jgi:hypothetical protein